MREGRRIHTEARVFFLFPVKHHLPLWYLSRSQTATCCLLWMTGTRTPPQGVTLRAHLRVWIPPSSILLLSFSFPCVARCAFPVTQVPDCLKATTHEPLSRPQIRRQQQSKPPPPLCPFTTTTWRRHGTNKPDFGMQTLLTCFALVIHRRAMYWECWLWVDVKVKEWIEVKNECEQSVRGEWGVW